MSKKLFLLVSLLILPWFQSFGQNTIAFQGFEGSPADNWGFTAPTQAAGPGQVIVGAGNYGAGYAKTGSFSMRAAGGSTSCGTGSANCINGAGVGGGCNNLPNGRIVQFSAINVACLSGVQISVSHRSHILCAGQGQGFDASERIFFEVSLNGASFTSIGQLTGGSNYTWSYSTNPAGSGTTVPNPFVYNVPAGTNTVAFRTRANVDRADEVYYIDDVRITTTTNGYVFPGSPGIWNGLINTDWTNQCNWENRVLPTTTTDVIIPNAALNICEVLNGLTGNCRDLTINKSTLAVEYFTSTLNVTGDLTIDNNGLLDMSLGGLQGGTLNLGGNWLNKRDETFFDEGLGLVVFNGAANQTISVTNDVKEIFYKATVNKPSANLIANTDIWIDFLNTGGATNMLTLSNGIFDLNGNQLTVYNPNFQAISRTGGGILSERTDNASSITWKINSNTGNFLFPFVSIANNYIPLTYTQTAGNAGDLTISTYGTPPDNLPWPSTPVNVTNLVSSSGLLPDNRDATVDRFWQIDNTGSSTADITFSYTASELPVSPYNNPLSIKAQRFTNVTDEWLTYLPGQSAGIYFVTVPDVTDFSTWTLTNIISPLPIELLLFDAELNNETVDIIWITSTEINNDFFTVQRSRNGIDFEDIVLVNGAGNSSGILNYNHTDLLPFTGISYYRLKQTDYDGKVSYSKSVAVNIPVTSTTFGIDYLIMNSDNSSLSAFVHAKDNSKLLIEMSDMLGRVINTRNFDYINNITPVDIDIAGLGAGIYFVNITDGYTRETRKIFVK